MPKMSYLQRIAYRGTDNQVILKPPRPFLQRWQVLRSPLEVGDTTPLDSPHPRPSLAEPREGMSTAASRQGTGSLYSLTANLPGEQQQTQKPAPALEEPPSKSLNLPPESPQILIPKEPLEKSPSGSVERNVLPSETAANREEYVATEKRTPELTPPSRSAFEKHEIAPPPGELTARALPSSTPFPPEPIEEVKTTPSAPAEPEEEVAGASSPSPIKQKIQTEQAGKVAFHAPPDEKQLLSGSYPTAKEIAQAPSLSTNSDRLIAKQQLQPTVRLKPSHQQSSEITTLSDSHINASAKTTYSRRVILEPISATSAARLPQAPLTPAPVVLYQPVTPEQKSKRSQKDSAVHIGSIDIQIVPEPASSSEIAKPAAQAQSVSLLSRGFTSTFGLRQG